MSDKPLTVVYSPHYLDYDFGPGHPFTPVRWRRLRERLVDLALPIEWIEPEAAADSDVLKIHSLPFVEAVKVASAGHGTNPSGHYGLGTGDVPIFYDMHAATLAVCGGTLRGAQELIDSGSKRVLQLGGGLHHAMPGLAAGFCVYNDVALAIRHLVDSGLRVGFVDVDVHHSDGVQAILYNEPRALTISLHESGRFLFPGTGFENERGGPEAPGSAVNVPLHPGTGDASYLECFDAIVPMALEEFKPDVMVVEVGADPYEHDPLAHLSLTFSGFAQLFDRIVRLAEKLAGGRLLVTLGGGYDVNATVEIWTLLAARLAEQRIPHPATDNGPLSLAVSRMATAREMNRATVSHLKDRYWSNTIVSE